MEFVDSICLRFGLTELENIQILKEISAKVGVKPAHIGLGLFTLASLFFFMEYGTYWIAFAVGFIYPAYMSYKSIELQDSKDDKHWLTYWVVFSCVNVIDKFFGFLLQVIPMYNLVKIAYFVWLFHPSTQGSKIMYEKGLRKLLKKYESQIDTQLTRIGDAVENSKPMLNNLIKDAKQEVVNRVVDQAIEDTTGVKKNK